MKIRGSFVTNSSSTSFVIASKKDLLQSTLELPQELLQKILEEVLEYCDTITTIEELNEYYLDEREMEYEMRYGNYTFEEALESYGLTKEYNKQKEQIENGYKLVFKQLSTDDEELFSMGFDLVCDIIKALGNNDDIIIDGDGNF